MHKIDRLTSVRGIAALHVVLFHCQGVIAGFNLTPWTNLLEKGYLAVDFFFVLSGFIIAYVYAEEFDRGRGGYRRFLWLRLARIYPVHLVLLAVVLAAWGFGEVFLSSNTPRTLAGNILLVHSWGITRRLSFNFPSWSVSAEWFAYLAFPLLLWLSKPLARRPALAGAGALAAILALAVCASLLLPPGITVAGKTLETDAGATRPFDMAATFALVRVTLEFLAGVLLFRAYCALRGQALRWVSPSTLVAAGVLVLTLHTTLLPPIVQDTLSVAAAAMLILCLALGGGAGGPLDGRAARFFGEAWSSIYMVHGVVILAYVQLVDRHIISSENSLAGGFLRAAIVVAIVVALGIMVYRFVEVPSRHVMRALADRFR